MEELVSGTSPELVEGVASGIGVGNLMGTGAIGAMLIAAVLFFVNWKTSGSKSIKKRFDQYKTKKAEIAHGILVNEKQQVELKAVIENTAELSAEQETKIAEITDKAANDIKESLAVTNPRVTVNRINKKWNN